VFIRGTDVEDEPPILWPPDAKGGKWCDWGRPFGELASELKPEDGGD